MARPALDIRNDIQIRFPGATIVDRGPGWMKHDVGGGLLNWTGLSGDARIHFGDGPFDEDAEIDTAWVDGDPIEDAPWLKVMKHAMWWAYFGPGTLAFDAGQIIRYVYPDPIDPQQITFQPMQMQWTNLNDQIEPIADPASVVPIINDDSLLFISAYGPGLDFEWQAQTQRLAKLLHINSLAELGEPTLLGPDLSLKVQFIFQTSADIDVIIDGEKWDKSTRVATNAEVQFEYEDLPIWSFKVARAMDANGDEVLCQQVFRRSGASLFVEVRVPWSWLESAAYPVIVDPSVNEIVGASANDAQQGSTGFVTVDGAYITMGTAGNWGGFGFTTVDADGTVSEAYISIQCANTSLDDPNVRIRAEDEDDVALGYSPGSTYDISGRNYTTEYTDWVATGIGAGSYVASPNIADEIQEVWDRPGWSPNNDMAIAMANLSAGTFTVYAWDQDTGRCAKLDITYSSAVARPVLPLEIVRSNQVPVRKLQM